MTARALTKDEMEAMKNGLMTNMKLRKNAYHILKSGDLKKLDDLVPSPLGGPNVSYREILDCWKKELESPSSPCPVPTFLKRLGINSYWKFGARDGSDSVVACPIDFSLLGLDPKKIPDLSHLKFVNSQKKDLEEIWRLQDEGFVITTSNGFDHIFVKPNQKNNRGKLRSTLEKGSETTISTKGKSRSR